MKDITLFINTELKPRLWDYIPSIFPQMEFKLIRDKWCSRLHYDGRAATHPTEDKSVITRKYPHSVYDNARQQSKDLITLYMELNNISEVWEAVNELCDKVGIARPETTPEAKEQYRKSEERRSALELSAERQKKALYTPDGAETLKYLYSRGWTDEEIKEAELGYISPVEATSIQAQRTVGDFYTLSIPLRSGSRIYGFKFRTLQPVERGQSKYVYLYGTDKRTNLFNLTGIKQKDGEIIVVEGELDALHAQVRGISGVVATSGGGLTEELLDSALSMGVRRITLLMDKDERGESFVSKSVSVAWSKRISVLVATFPENETLPDGTKIHDVDEYLRVHSPEDLKSLIRNAMSGGSYLLDSLVNKAISKNGGNITDSEERDLTHEVIKLANSVADQTERDIILSRYSEALGKSISKEALQAVADEERAIKDALTKRQQAEDATKRISSLMSEGRVDEALILMGETSKDLRQINAKEKYSSLLAVTNEDSLSKRMRNRQGEIPTLYELCNDKGERERLTLPCGAITFIVAPTSHGKSTLLQNITLQVANTDGDGAILYFTFEEDAESVTLQLLNKYINTDLCNNYNSSYSNNLRAISHYYRRGEDRFIRKEQLDIFHSKRKEFFSSLVNSGKLRIYYEDYDSTELIEAIRYIHSQTKVKAVFVDYVQLLSKNGNRKQRTEELKDICKELKDLSIQTQLPIVVAAQSNREVTSPLEMHSQKIAEASDLERIANKIVFVWNTSFVAQKSKESQSELAKFQEANNIELGKGGQIYVKLTKNRGGVANLDAVLDFNGNTGVIDPNCSPTQQGQPPIFETQQNTKDPF